MPLLVERILEMIPKREIVTQVATKKLSELMESHHPRAFVRRRVLKKWNGVTRLEEVKGRDFHELFGRMSQNVFHLICLSSLPLVSFPTIWSEILTTQHPHSGALFSHQQRERKILL